MKKIVLLIIISIVFFSCKNNKDTIYIGAVLPLTGDVAVYGNNTKEGIDLAVNQVNEKGGINGKKIEVLYEDSKALPKEGVNGIEKLIATHNVQYVIDNSVSSVALAMVSIAEKNKVVLLSTGSTNPKLTGISDYFFRIWNSDAFEGKLTADFAIDTLGLNSISTLYVNNDYGVSLNEVFSTEIKKKNGKILSQESFKQDETDFSTQLTKIKNNSPDAIYIIGYSKEISNVLLQIKKMNIKCQVLGTVTMEDRQVIDVAGVSANNVIYPFPQEPDTTKPTVSKFQSSFYKTYGKKPGITCDVGYDAIMLFAEAVKLGGGTKSGEIQIGLNKIKNYYGASGLIEFNKGDVRKPMIFKRILNNNFELYKSNKQ